MKETSSTSRSHERWAHFRFSVIGPLLAAPASRGELQGQLQELAAKKWRHPISGEWVLFGLSTIERWYYKALRSKAGPVEALKRKIRSDHGQHPQLSPPVRLYCFVASSPTHSALQCRSSPLSCLDGPTTPGSLPLHIAPEVPAARPRQHLRPALPTPR